jgi:hypothetical protein
MAAAYRGDTFRAMSRAICLAALCGLGAPALASPRSDPTAGRAVFTGATMPGATSIDLNPAALGLGLVENEIYVAAMAVVDRYAVDRQNLDVTTGALSPGASVRDVELGPGAMFAYTFHAKDRATVAVELHSAPAMVFPNAQPLQYHALGGGQRAYSATIATQLKITNELQFGVSLAAQKSYLHLRYARDSALAAGRGPNGITSSCAGSPCGVENPQATEIYDVNVQSPWFSISETPVINIGLVVQLAREMWLGVSYHTPPGLSVQNSLVGTMDVTRAPRDGGNRVLGGATVYISQPASADAELRAGLAQQLELHVGVHWEDLSRMSSYDVRGYGSSFSSAGVPEWTERPLGFHDPLAMWAGVEQVGNRERWRFGGRIGFETSAVSDDRTSPVTIAPLSYTADVGAQVRLSPMMFLQVSYGLQYFPTVHVTDSAFDPRNQIACTESGYDYSTSACEAVRFGYGIPTAAGDYSRMEHAIRFGVRYEIP